MKERRFIHRHLAFLLVTGLAVTAWPLAASAKARPVAARAEKSRRVDQVEPDWSYAEKKLRQAGLKSQFIKKLKSGYVPDEFNNVLELNVLLYLRKVDHHGPQVTDEAVERVHEFIAGNKAAIEEAEKTHKVPGTVIASLLWMESRYGENLGRFHVASVFLDLVQAARPDVIEDLRENGVPRFSDRPSRKDLKKIPGRAKKKAAWALGELKALQKIFLKHGASALAFRGSFAGAYGMPQFLPSSYSRYAQSFEGKKAPDLTDASDAIMSVANYLRANGWRSSRPKSHVRALMNYNNSRDYANAILRIAERAGGRGLASERKSRGRE